MCFVRKHQHIMLMGKLNDAFYIRANSVISRVVHQNSLCIRIFLDSFFNVLNGHSKRYSKLFVCAWIYINRYSTAHNKCIDSTSVNVSRHYYLISCLTACKYHRLYCSSSTIYYKESVLCTKSLSGKHFSIFYHRNRVTKVVKWLHGVYIALQTIHAQKVTKLFIHSSALVTRYVKTHHSVPHMFF